MTSEQLIRIITNTTRMATKANAPVSDMQKAFLIKLINYMESTQAGADYTITLSLKEMATALDIPKRTVIEAVKALTAAGVLIRKSEAKELREYKENPMMTTVDKKVFQ